MIEHDHEDLLSEWRDSMAQVNISDQVSYAVCRPSCKVTRLGRGDAARLQLQLVSGLLASPTRRHRRVFLVWLPAREPFPRPRVRFSFFLFGAPVCVGHAPAPGCSPGRKVSRCSSRAAQSAPCAPILAVKPHCLSVLGGEHLVGGPAVGCPGWLRAPAHERAHLRGGVLLHRNCGVAPPHAFGGQPASRRAKRLLRPCRLQASSDGFPSLGLWSSYVILPPARRSALVQGRAHVCWSRTARA